LHARRAEGFVLGAAFGAVAGRRVLLLIAERDARVLTEHGELLGTCTIDPAKGYQALSKPVVPGMS